MSELAVLPIVLPFAAAALALALGAAPAQPMP